MEATLRRTGKIRIVIAFFSLFVFTILLSFGAHFLSDLRKTQESSVAREHPATLQNAPGPQMNESAGTRPSNRHSQVMAAATKAADETAAAAEMLLHEIEPPSVKDINLGAANRDDLEALRRDLETAAANTATVMPRYLALLKSERDKVENYVRSLNAEKDSVTRLLAAIDKRHAEITGLTSQLLMARADFYRTYETYVSLLAREFGGYKVANGQFIFPIQRTVDRYNIAAHAMAVAAKRVAELEQERRRLLRLQQDQWRLFINQNG
jgi:hypothetical protein